jgi:hypothetical protein
MAALWTYGGIIFRAWTLRDFLKLICCFRESDECLRVKNRWFAGVKSSLMVSLLL